MLKVIAYVLRFIIWKDVQKKTFAAYLHTKDVFTSKQYEQFKQDLGFIVIDGVIGCKGRLVIVCYHSISNILYFFKNINLQS